MTEVGDTQIIFSRDSNMSEEFQIRDSYSAEARQKRILEILNFQGSASVSDLSARLGVSEVTVRKDLSQLEAENRLYRTHGRAVPICSYVVNRHLNEKEKIYSKEKMAIGRVAASLVKENDSLLIASGTTVLYAAKEMMDARGLTVISASVSVSSILSQNRGIDVVQLGGIVRESSVSVVGSFAENMLTNFNCSRLLMGADGVDLQYGVTTTNIMEASLNQMMMKASKQTILLVDSSKFGKRGFSKICDVGDVDIVITDAGIPQNYLDSLKESGVEVIVAPLT